MKKEVIGHTDCPVCSHNEAHVKLDKNGHAFIFCPDCAAQAFTRNEHRHRKLIAKMRPVTVTDTAQEQEKPKAEPEKPAQPPAQAVQPKKTEPAHKVPATPKKPPEPPVTQPQKPKTSWFTPILGAQ